MASSWEEQHLLKGTIQDEGHHVRSYLYSCSMACALAQECVLTSSSSSACNFKFSHGEWCGVASFMTTCINREAPITKPYVTICAGLTRPVPPPSIFIARQNKNHYFLYVPDTLYILPCASYLVCWPSMQNLPQDPLHVINFTRPSPMLILQATNTGVRRPGYEATIGCSSCLRLVALFLRVDHFLLRISHMVAKTFDMKSPLVRHRFASKF